MSVKIELKKFAPLHPVRVKPKQIVARSHAFSRAFRQLYEILVLIGSLDCLLLWFWFYDTQQAVPKFKRELGRVSN